MFLSCSTTLTDIVCRVKVYTDNIIVVLDGDPEKSLKLLRDADLHTEIVCYEQNKGKGTALKEGFARAIRMGYEYAITIDSDGQHFPEDIPLFIETFMQNKGAFIVGARDFSNPNMPHGNNFANKFSNFNRIAELFFPTSFFNIYVGIIKFTQKII